MDIKELYENTELTIQQIADELGRSFSYVFRWVHRNYPREFRLERKRTCYRNSKLGTKNPQFGKFGEDSAGFVGTVSDSKGYWMRLKPHWYTGRKGSRHVFEHHIVVCEGLGITEIPAKWQVHHCDFDTANNSFDNLVLMTMHDHMKLHRSYLKGATTISKESTLKWVEAHGTPWKRDDIVSSAWEHAAADKAVDE